MASITFWGNIVGGDQPPSGINHTTGSGLGFFGTTFGISVPVGQFQDSTWVTNSLGTQQGFELANTKYASVSGAYYNRSSQVTENRRLANYKAPLRIRFEHTEPVMVQNCKLRIFDRNNIQKHASGVTTQVYEVRHPHPSTEIVGLAHRPSVSHAWAKYDPTIPGEPPDLILTSSPGVSGLNTDESDNLPPNSGGFLIWSSNQGSAHESSIHDWYIALSASPQGIGSKTQYGLYFTCEYL